MLLMATVSLFKRLSHKCRIIINFGSNNMSNIDKMY